ncbi:unnamed protein product (macronuclear) [Paramecium tetraurelia]|uniref:Uncharacterized protein n=1 Tax=Paramecium tetraurelia TaxID=5888 RepID=A0C590_PARTE|nr:uncharacterized protein GSPATT00006456001 [Paramecium tetraurelia]CAK65957.1 unnamed protein product [Paramecium tetraurelia]|eukprot:XP_001433354.1 hypothetical protein (macronuclear) [Paramecium tetraurelia strain d4-2]
MDDNYIKQVISKTLDSQLLNFENCQNASYQNKLVETLRNSNQVEIMNIKTKYIIQDNLSRYKQIFNTVVQTFINLIKSETEQQQSKILLKNMEQIQLIESQKKKLNEYSILVQQTNDENIQLRTQLQLMNQDSVNLNLILHYQKVLSDLQLELDQQNTELLQKDKQIYQQELLIQSLKLEIQKLKQQIIQFNTKFTEKNIEIQKKQQSKILKDQSTQIEMMEEINLNQYEKLVSIQKKQNQNTFVNQSQRQPQSVSLPITRIRQSNIQDCDIQSTQIIENDFRKCQTQNQMNNSTNQKNLIQLSKIKIRKLKNLNDLYLYSKSQRNSRVDVDQYYEPSLLYRYNVLEGIKK